MTLRAAPWLIFPPAVDLANTVIITADRETELLTDDEELAHWIAAERGRIDDVDAAAGRIEDVRTLRDEARSLLRARAADARLPASARRRLNARAAAAPTSLVLAADGKITLAPATDDRFARFAAAIARSAIELAGSRDIPLEICGAPSCGMLYLRDDPRQVWCSRVCGNRARVARHAARRRSTTA